MKISNKIKIREIKKTELDILKDMLYEAIFQPEGVNPLPRDIISTTKIHLYIDKFGQKKDDYCFVADMNGQIIGAVWIRILAGEIPGYGNIEDKTPEFAISLFKEYRNKGIGTLLMKRMISYLQEQGYAQTSLSVEKRNYSVKLYQKLGFEIIDENNDDYIMLKKLNT